MIKAKGDGPRGKVLILGLSHGNLDRLREGQPIKFDGHNYGFEGEVIIFAGETEATMARLLMDGNPDLVPTLDPSPS